MKEELDIQVKDLPDNYITAKRKLRNDYNPRIQSVNDEILRVKGEIGDLKVGLVETGVDVGPAIYLARTFDTDVDSVVKFFIFILIFVFDPLAVMLVVAFNQALMLREENGVIESPKPKSKSWWKFWEMYGEEKEKTQTEHWKDIYNEPIEVKPDVDDLPIIEEDEEAGLASPTKKGGVKIITDFVKNKLK